MLFRSKLDFPLDWVAHCLLVFFLINFLLPAEQWALRAYWYFMLLVAFTGSALLRVFEELIGGNLGTVSLWTSLNHVSTTIPNEVSAAWINWIIFVVASHSPIWLAASLL